MLQQITEFCKNIFSILCTLGGNKGQADFLLNIFSCLNISLIGVAIVKVQ